MKIVIFIVKAYSTTAVIYFIYADYYTPCIISRFNFCKCF